MNKIQYTNQCWRLSASYNHLQSYTDTYNAQYEPGYLK